MDVIFANTDFFFLLLSSSSPFTSSHRSQLQIGTPKFSKTFCRILYHTKYIFHETYKSKIYFRTIWLRNNKHSHSAITAANIKLGVGYTGVKTSSNQKWSSVSPAPPRTLRRCPIHPRARIKRVFFTILHGCPQPTLHPS